MGKWKTFVVKSVEIGINCKCGKTHDYGKTCPDCDTQALIVLCFAESDVVARIESERIDA